MRTVTRKKRILPMNTYQRMAIACAAVGMSCTPALAATITSPAATTWVTATGQYTISQFGGAGPVRCNVTWHGWVSAPNTITIEYGSGHSDTGCNNFQPVFPVNIRFATNTTPITSTVYVDISGLRFSTPIGTCSSLTAKLGWNNSTSTASSSVSQAFGLCTLHSMSLDFNLGVSVVP